jgi:hypothetical protein
MSFSAIADESEIRVQFFSYLTLAVLVSLAAVAWVFNINDHGIIAQFIPSLLLLAVGVFACAKLIVINNENPDLLKDSDTQ